MADEHQKGFTRLARKFWPVTLAVALGAVLGGVGLVHRFTKPPCSIYGPRNSDVRVQSTACADINGDHLPDLVEFSAPNADRYGNEDCPDDGCLRNLTVRFAEFANPGRSYRLTFGEPHTAIQIKGYKSCLPDDIQFTPTANGDGHDLFFSDYADSTSGKREFFEYRVLNDGKGNFVNIVPMQTEQPVYACTFSLPQAR